jgi:methylenetetrahydrofolate dehydrogenase (NADP+) / methenyltetrahydrofolate cyclohydrolase
VGYELIDGAALAATIRADVERQVAALAAPPSLATILVGDDPASEVYVTRKRQLCVEAGMRDLHHRLPADVTQAEVGALIAALSADPDVTGILLQLPLPAHLNARRLIALIDPDKDVDGLTAESAGRLALDEPGLRPCTPTGVMRLLDAYDVELEGMEAVVVGRSDLVGRPQAQMLLERDATVTSCHKGTRDLQAMTRRADVLVVAAGVRGLITRAHVKPGATVIDVGIHRTPDGLRGDVAFAEVAPIVKRITPVPGGVGPMTIAMLLANTVAAVGLQAEAQAAARIAM